MVLTITSENFDDEVMNNDKPVLIDFWADWCGPCRMVAPVMEKLDENYSDQVVIGKINVDEETELAEQFRVMSIPTLYVIKDGEVVERLIGARPYAELESVIKRYF
jgi:thioredoxin 1